MEDKLKHTEELLGNCIDYLWEIWNNEDTDTIRENYKRLGFTKKDMNYWEIEDELKRIDEEFENRYMYPWEKY